MKAINKTIILLTVATITTSCGTDDQVNVEAKVSTRAVVDAPEAFAMASTHGDVPINWINAFDDPLLLKLIAEGRANNSDLQAAAAGVEKSWLVAKQAGVGLKPNVAFTAGGSGSGTLANSSANSNMNAGLQVSWELDVWGRIRSGISAAEASAKSVEADYKYAQYSLAANISKTYFKVIDAKLQTEVALKNLAILTETVRITSIQKDNGMVSAQDLALARGNLATAKGNLINLQASKRDAVRALELLLGRYPNADLDVPNAFPALPKPPPAGIPSQILERRPDIISADLKVAAAFNRTTESKAAKLPKISLTGNLGVSSSSLSALANPSSMAWQLGANLLAPIFDGGAAEINVKISTAEQKQALASYASVALKAFSEIETNLDQGVALAAREKALTIAQEEFKEAYRIADLRHKAAETDLLSVLQIQQQAISADANLYAIQRAQLEQRINLYLSLGGSWE